MGVTVQEEQDGVQLMRITGLLKKSELDAVQAEAAKKLDSDPSLSFKLLIVVENFAGWERGADWDDMSFYAGYGDKITKIAIVGDPAWESDMLLFAGAGVRLAPVRYFNKGQLAEAKDWLR